MNVSRWVLPILVITMLVGGYSLRTVFTKPTTSVVFSGEGSAKMVCKVDGVRCKGTAGFFTKLYQDVPGIASLETIAEEHLATFRYDPAVITPDSIKAIMEQEFKLRDGSVRKVFTLVEMR